MNLNKNAIAAARRRAWNMDHGVLVPDRQLCIAGAFEVEHWRDGELLSRVVEPNIVVNQGLNHILDVTLHAATQIPTWYVGIFEGNYTPVATDTAANIATNSTESSAYAESVRQTYQVAAASSQSSTNSANKAVFTCNATKVMYGAFLVSSSTKGGTSGTLLCASKFSASRSVVNGDTISITYTITAADA